MFNHISEEEMKIQRALGVATYVKIVREDISLELFLQSYPLFNGCSYNPKILNNRLGKYAVLLDRGPHGTFKGSYVRLLKSLEDDFQFFVREEDFEII